MHPFKEAVRAETRRQFFGRTARGIGGLALANLLADDAFGRPGQDPAPPLLPHFAPKATRCIYLHMMGAPPQMDLLDYKPRMRDWYDRDLPESIRQGQRLTQRQGNLLVQLLVGCHSEPGWLAQCHLTGTASKSYISILVSVF